MSPSSPLASWESKARRLNAVVAVFRAENARVRGMDPTNIRAFDVPMQLGLEAAEDTAGFPLPDEMRAFASERDELAERLDRQRAHSSAGLSSAAQGDVNRSGPRRAAEVAA